MLVPNRHGSSNSYRYGFNGKEKNDEIKGEGVQYDYGFRNYDARVGRPLSIDPLTAQYPELSPYQFFSNNPIWFIDLDGLEGVRYLEVMQMKDGTITSVKQIVEVDVYVATSKVVNSIHYKSADLPIIQSNLNTEYNKGFKDANDNTVEFRFNVIEFDADLITPSNKAQQLRKEKTNYVKAKKEGFDFIMGMKGFVLERGKLEGETQGMTVSNHVIINDKANNPSHTQAHETGHIFMNYDSDKNPVSAKQHQKAGGIFRYRVVDENGNTIDPTQNTNQGNIDVMLESLPEIDCKEIEEK